MESPREATCQSGDSKKFWQAENRVVLCIHLDRLLRKQAENDTILYLRQLYTFTIKPPSRECHGRLLRCWNSRKIQTNTSEKKKRRCRDLPPTGIGLNGMPTRKNGRGVMWGWTRVLLDTGGGNQHDWEPT